MQNEQLAGIDYCFNPRYNSGEEFVASLKIFTNGEELYQNWKFILESYSNQAIFNLTTIEITPKQLRNLADKIEEETKIAQNKLEEETKIAQNKLDSIKKSV